jgi:hypothetical protein
VRLTRRRYLGLGGGRYGVELHIFHKISELQIQYWICQHCTIRGSRCSIGYECFWLERPKATNPQGITTAVLISIWRSYPVSPFSAPSLIIPQNHFLMATSRAELPQANVPFPITQPSDLSPRPMADNANYHWSDKQHSGLEPCAGSKPPRVCRCRRPGMRSREVHGFLMVG